MDQTIRKILELDAATEERQKTAELQCSKRVSEAREQARAMAEAQAHQTRDTILEFEEQTREAFEQQTAELRADFEHRAEIMTQQFEAQYDSLLETLFRNTLLEAEA